MGQQRWKTNGGKGAWWWQTGVGKTFGTCDLMKRMIASNSSSVFYIVVPGPELVKQWSIAIEAYLPKNYQDNVSIFTIHKIVEEAKNGKTFVCSCLILDEMHEYYSDERIRIFFGDYVQFKWILGLTANYEDLNNRHKLIEDVLPVIDRIDDDEAVREGYISKYIEYNLGIYLTENESIRYEELSKQVSLNMSKFSNGLQSMNQVLSSIGKKDYSLIYAIATNNGWSKTLNLLDPKQHQINELWHPSKIIGYAVNGLKAVRERKELVYTSINKLKVAVDIVTKFDKLKTICFSQSTAFANTLALHINDYYKNLNNTATSSECVVYHSNLDTIIYIDEKGKQKKKGKTILKREAVDALKNNKSRVMSTVSSMDKGIDIPDLRLSLTTSGTQNPTQHNQRKGRSVRFEEDDVIALIINVYAKGTIDEKWLKNRQSKSKNVVYTVDNVNDIVYNPRVKEVFNDIEI